MPTFTYTYKTEDGRQYKGSLNITEGLAEARKIIKRVHPKRRIQLEPVEKVRDAQ